MISLLIAAALAQSPSSPDLSKDPRLQQSVDVHLKRATIYEFETYLKKHTDQHFSVEYPADKLMVCVFAKKQPLWKLLKGVASVTGCYWEDLRSEWRLKVDPVAKSALKTFGAAEDKYLKNVINERGKALGDLASKGGFDAGGHAAGKSQDGPDDITPSQWAKKLIGEKAYYVAGAMFHGTPILHDNLLLGGSKLDSTDDFVQVDAPQAFMLTPPGPDDKSLYQRVAPNDDQINLEGTQILMRVLRWAGTIEVVELPPVSAVAKPKSLAPIPTPKNELAKSAGGKWILEWETDLASAKDSWLDQPVEPLFLKSDFFKENFGIEEYLEALHDATGQTVISDAFRVPVIDSRPLKEQSTPREWLASLRDSQKCFVRIEDGTAMVRHGGFWDLRTLEPDEDTIRALEAIKAPDLIDYADFAMRFESEDVRTGAPDPFFDCSEIPLVRFDPKPFQDSFTALLAFGQLTPQGRVNILTGGWFDTFNILKQEKAFLVPNPPTTRNVPSRGQVTAYQPPSTAYVHITASRASDIYLNASARYSPFFGAPVQGFELSMMQSLKHTRDYLNLTGQFPPMDSDEKELCDDDYCQAHLFHLLSQTFPLIDFKNYNLDGSRNDPRILYGPFKFWAGFSAADGVVEQVDIPVPPRSRRCHDTSERFQALQNKHSRAGRRSRE